MSFKISVRLIFVFSIIATVLFGIGLALTGWFVNNKLIGFLIGRGYVGMLLLFGSTFKNGGLNLSIFLISAPVLIPFIGKKFSSRDE